MANIFNSIFNRKVRSSNFDMTYDHKLTMQMGNLVPVHVQDVLPGDRIRQSCEVMIRFAPLLAPIMHKVDCYVHFFFVPNRLLWPRWEEFITSGDTGQDNPVHPFLHLDTGPNVGTLYDYLGIPMWTGVTHDINALPFAAYQFIWDAYYRDQNLQAPFDRVLYDGNNNGRSFDVLRKRAWQHDYFTSALPYAQKGDPVSIPIGNFNDVNVYYDPSVGLSQVMNYYDGSGMPTPGQNLVTGTTTTEGTRITDSTGKGINIDPRGTLKADTSELVETSTTIADLRNAFRLQEWLEKNARGGTRYVESLLSHFGVRSSDARLNRPEYLGGARTPVVISEVLQTSSTDATSPQANMAGHGISVGAGKAFDYRVEEHGWILGIMSVMPNTAYFQGIPRMFSRKSRLDYYWPTFQHIGEQAVLNKELFAATAQGDEVFGYVPRYAEYKYIPSRVSGDFKTSLKYWHMAREFSTLPALNSDFIVADPTERIFAVTDPDIDKLWCHCFHNINMWRKMDKYANPSF